MKYGLIGEKLGHSFSKIIHNQLADYEYELCEIALEDFDSFMEAREFNAINVTIPYKQKVIPYLHYISPEAEEIGAVNVVVNKDGKLYGYNSDLGGILALINRMNLDFKGKKVLICGTGGTSNTAYVAAKSLGASEIIKLSRSGKGEAITYEEAYENYSDAEMIINTTPGGMYPNIEGKPIDLSRFPNLEGVVDAIYNPLRTQLVMDAIDRGIPAEGGLYMLVMQAVLASEIFIDTKYDKEISDRIFNNLMAEKENLVLIGMPGSGKTTIGNKLTKKLSKALVDTDEEIEKRIPFTISEMIKTEGEPAFRNLESEVIAEVSKLNGSVISTGGGAILRPENIRNLKLNGKIIFLDRPLESLVPTDTRPLSSDFEALKKRFEERYDKYLAACDIHISGDRTPESTVYAITEAIK